MYIAPNSDVYLLEDVPLDPTYEHTVMWADDQVQETWFVTHAAHSFTQVSYARHEQNSIKLEVPIEDVINCNYMAFRNTAFENKMFYAFVTNIEMLNNVTCEIFFELDVMQTYLFDAVLEECWVEREHSATDVPGDNLKPEPFDTGPMIISSWEESGYFSNYKVLLCDAFSES